LERRKSTIRRAPASFALDARRAKEVLGWEPQVSFDEGVRRTMKWWRKTIEPAS
jgi:nucleoside-diphosphate-sugar epimerase